MKVQRRSLDRISALPEDTIEKILTLMPIQDALRTSILSKKWRYSWTRMPKLVFDRKMANVSSGTEELDKYKLLHAIFHVLLLHRGPILEFRIWIINTLIVNEIDQIILHLSWSKNIKKLELTFESANRYKLPFSFFLLQKLEHLDISYCQFEPPLMFDGFSKLKSLRFFEVEISFTMLQRFLTSCPLLEEFTLNFTAGGMSKKLPTSLVYLRIIDHSVCFQIQDELSSTLCVINSSPNLEKIGLTMFRNPKLPSTTLLDPQDYSGLKLDHLKELEIQSFYHYAADMEFVKLILAKSPVLKKAHIMLTYCDSVHEEVKMLRDLLQVMQFPRASPAAKLIIEP